MAASFILAEEHLSAATYFKHICQGVIFIPVYATIEETLIILESRSFTGFANKDSTE